MRKNVENISELIGEYVAYIEHEVILNNRKVSRQDLIGFLEARRLTCQFMCIPSIGQIPGMNLL